MQPTWDLDSIFPGGSSSQDFSSYMDDLACRIDELRHTVAACVDSEDVSIWVTAVEEVQEILTHQRQCGAFVSCLLAADVKDTKAAEWRDLVNQYSAELTNLLTAWDSSLLSLSDEALIELLSNPTLATVQFVLKERILRAKDKLDLNTEALLTDLMVDGYHGWGELYSTISGAMKIPVQENGEVLQLSLGQANNRLNSSDSVIRRETFQSIEDTFSKQSDVYGQILNHIGGFRLRVYGARGWEDVLQEPLTTNRMQKSTLDAMWTAIEKNKHRFVPYLQKKAKLLGMEKLGWEDIHAPLGNDKRTMTYDEAAEYIVAQFAKLHPEMSEFAEECFDEQWIEVEDRPGKRQGGFCTRFPASGESRIFMTFSGSMRNVATLAHELGHAYHGHVLQELPFFLQNYAMNVAETASTFAEQVVSDASVKSATNVQERLALLDEKIGRSISMLMDIHSRFLFETKFYEARQERAVSVTELNSLMVKAQKEAFMDELSSYHPHFWASKLHFYLTKQPFYNFPYTFGYLFSLGIHARAVEEGMSFAEKYDALLYDTASMNVEELAQKHLGVDLSTPDFWQTAIDVAVLDVEEFLALS